jgi:hypothetical protein
MKRVKNWWLPMLLGAVLMATLVSVAGARPADRPMAAISRRITIPAGHFIPADHNVTWYNGGFTLQSDSDKSLEWFSAPVVFPTGQSVVVESVTLYAYDNNSLYDLCLWLYRTDPTAGNEVEMAEACSTGWMITNPRHFTDSSIANNPVKHGKGVYLYLNIEDDTDLKVYGVRIQYHHGTT